MGISSTWRPVARAAIAFFVSPKQTPPENSHFGQIRSGRVGMAVLERRLQRALALQLLAKSDRLRKGGCALKRLSEDFRICHGREWLDQGAFSARLMSRAVYRRASGLRCAGSAYESEKPSSRSTGVPSPCGSTTVAAEVGEYRIARCIRPSTGRPRSIASWRRHAGVREELCQSSRLSR
jgi:hypothetical protein